MASEPLGQCERQPEDIIDGLVAAFNRYGHHDHDCPRHDVFDGADECECGFNVALSAALGRETPPIRPPLARRSDLTPRGRNGDS